MIQCDLLCLVNDSDFFPRFFSASFSKFACAQGGSGLEALVVQHGTHCVHVSWFTTKVIRTRSRIIKIVVIAIKTWINVSTYPKNLVSDIEEYESIQIMALSHPLGDRTKAMAASRRCVAVPGPINQNLRVYKQLPLGRSYTLLFCFTFIPWNHRFNISSQTIHGKMPPAGLQEMRMRNLEKSLQVCDEICVVGPQK